MRRSRKAKRVTAIQNTNRNARFQQDVGNVVQFDNFGIGVGKMYPEKDYLPQNVREAIIEQSLKY